MFNRDLFLACILISGFSIQAIAKVSESQCATKDYSNKFVAPKNQGDMGFCYAFATSDLLSEAAELKPPKTISAFDVAIQNIALTKKDVDAANSNIILEKAPLNTSSFIGGMSGGGGDSSFVKEHLYEEATRQLEVPLLNREGGDTEVISAHLINRGYACLESDIPSEKMNRKYIADTEHSYLDTDIQFIRNRMLQLSGYINVLNTERNTNLMKKLDSSCQLNPPVNGLDQFLPTKAALEQWAIKQLKKNTDKTCKEHVSTDGLKVHFNNISILTHEEAAKSMMRILDQDRPFEIDYDVSKLAKLPPGVSGNHASVVVGRHWNSAKKSCEVKIKNSWGNNCDTAKDPDSCKNGYWTVDADELASITTGTTWIEKKRQSNIQ